MPKKGKAITKEESQKIREKASLSQEEMNTLEQRLERDKEKIESPELKEILSEQKESKSSPSLTKINAPQKIPTRLEANFADNPISNDNSNGEEDSFKYNTGGERKSGEPKYFHYEGKIVEDIIKRTEIPNLGRGQPFERREVAFENSPQTRISVQENFEKYTPVAKVNKEKLGKESPFQRKEIKYTPEKY
jgi:hypothetical protein